MSKVQRQTPDCFVEGKEIQFRTTEKFLAVSSVAGVLEVRFSLVRNQYSAVKRFIGKSLTWGLQAYVLFCEIKGRSNSAGAVGCPVVFIPVVSRSC